MKLLIFDLDGTIVNSLPDLAGSALEKPHFPKISLEETAKSLDIIQYRA